MTYIRNLDRLNVACLTREASDRTCGPYWYCVTDYSTPQTAFRTRAAFQQWLDLRGLEVDDLPTEGDYGHRFIRGGYSIALHMDRAAWDAIDGVPVVAMDNAEYTMAKLAADDTGRIVEHILNCNVPDRPNFEHEICRSLEDEGRAHEIPPVTARRRAYA